MATTSGATTFCHIVEKGADEGIPDAGTPLYLEYDIRTAQRISGRPVAKMYTAHAGHRKFGGLVTYDQPPQHDLSVAVHPTAGRMFCLLQTTIHGITQAVMDERNSLVDPHAKLMTFFKREKIESNFEQSLRTLRKVPNATLFVMLRLES